MKSSTHPALLYSARILAMLWAAFWTWFGLASGIAEGLGPAGVLMHTVPFLPFVLLLLVAWRWEAAGGILLVLAGLFIAVAYPLVFRRMPLPTTIFVLLTMAVPPLLAGILFLAHWRLNKSKLT
jgi:hypothetical protein